MSENSKLSDREKEPNGAEIGAAGVEVETMTGETMTGETPAHHLHDGEVPIDTVHGDWQILMCHGVLVGNEVGAHPGQFLALFLVPRPTLDRHPVGLTIRIEDQRRGGVRGLIADPRLLIGGRAGGTGVAVRITVMTELDLVPVVIRLAHLLPEDTDGDTRPRLLAAHHGLPCAGPGDGEEIILPPDLDPDQYHAPVLVPA